MLNYIWLAMLVVGFIVGGINGRINEVTKAATDSAGEAVKLAINLLGIICFWTGLMGIAEKSGLTNLFARLMRPFIGFLFPEIKKDDRAINSILMNMMANFFGLGNAATPFGLKAMNELHRLNGKKDFASNSMCLFLVLNTSAIQLIPATIIAVRSAEGSVNPSSIIGTIWVSTLAAFIGGIITAKILSTFWKG